MIKYRLVEAKRSYFIIAIASCLVFLWVYLFVPKDIGSPSIILKELPDFSPSEPMEPGRIGEVKNDEDIHPLEISSKGLVVHDIK